MPVWYSYFVPEVNLSAKPLIKMINELKEEVNNYVRLYMVRFRDKISHVCQRQ